MSVSLEHLDQQHHAACLILVFYNLTLITHTHFWAAIESDNKKWTEFNQTSQTRSEERCTPTVGSAFINQAQTWNRSRDVSISHSSLNQHINIKNHKQQPEGKSWLLNVVVSQQKTNDQRRILPLGSRVILNVCVLSEAHLQQQTMRTFYLKGASDTSCLLWTVLCAPGNFKVIFVLLQVCTSGRGTAQSGEGRAHKPGKYHQLVSKTRDTKHNQSRKEWIPMSPSSYWLPAL